MISSQTLTRAPVTPRDVVAAVENTPQLVTDGLRERFWGYGVMGLPFDSGHVLGLRRFPHSSIGPGYTSVWHRSPDGRWSFWSTVSPEASCARYTGEISHDSRQTALEVTWLEPFQLTITGDEIGLLWDVTVTATPASRCLGAFARRLPDRFLSDERALRMLGPVAGAVLGAGRMSLTGRMPNHQTFHLVPSYVWRVTTSRARLDGTDLGRPAPLPRQARIGDFRIPQRGLLAVGVADFDPLDPSQHSTRTARA